MLRHSKKTDLADVIVYVHDSSDTNSFSYISNLRVSAPSTVDWSCSLTLGKQQYSLDHIPTLFVATKSDLDLAQQVCSLFMLAKRLCDVNYSHQRHEVQPDVYCRRLSLQVPVAVSVKTDQTADVFHAICSVAMHPYVCNLLTAVMWLISAACIDADILRFREALSEACHQPHDYALTSCCRRLWEVFLQGC